MWILDTGCGQDLVQYDTLPKASRDTIERASSVRNLHTANGTSQATKVASLQIAHFMENIQPYVLPATPNVLSIGRRIRNDGFELHWSPFDQVPRVWDPDGSLIPVEVHGDIPYFRDTINLSLREEHRGEDAVPAASLQGNLKRGPRGQRDANPHRLRQPSTTQSKMRQARQTPNRIRTWLRCLVRRTKVMLQGNLQPPFMMCMLIHLIIGRHPIIATCSPTLRCVGIVTHASRLARREGVTRKVP